MKKLLIFLLALLLCMSTSQETMAAEGWPANYGGVMLQGFYWDSYADTNWANLESQADELSNSFSLIWIPQSAKATHNPSMGYDPLYWFSDYNSSFGNKSQLVSMIKTFKSKGLGTIADIVVNHRGNVSNWVDFPKETYNGVTYQLQSTDIVSDDDNGATLSWANKNGYSLSSNTEETSESYGGKCEGWDGMRDLDHSSKNVQDNVKAYLKMLLSDEFGYVGFRYDMAKGFPAKYFAMYNQTANPTYSVGEFWDGNASYCKKWLNSTKQDGVIQSALFDFPFRYTVRDAINKSNWSNLGNTSVISDVNFRQYAVTFVENHDTERRSNAEQDPIKKDTLAANAFLLAMPGTPCVFLKHWQAYKTEIAAMIAARKAAGITNTSNFTNQKSTSGCYVNLVNDKLLVVVGSLAGSYPAGSDFTEILSGYHYKYYLAKSAEIAWADKASGQYVMPLNVKLTAVSATSGAQLVYTLDGTKPTASSTKVNSGTTINITGACTLTIGLLKNGTVSSIITRVFTEKEGDPIVSPTYVDGKVFAYFEKPSNWGTNINVWAWQKNKGGEDYLGVSWPGVTATKLGVTQNGNELWQWISNSTVVPDYIIFNDGSGNQTADLTFTNGGYYTKDGLQSVVSGIQDVYSVPGQFPAGNRYYNLNGQRVVPNRPGIYIHNGKKFVNK